MKVDKSQKVDRRVQRTRKLLHDALIELISEKEYESITVQNIIDRANFGRSTFYAHFQDKDDLLLFGMNDLIHSLMDGLEHSDSREKDSHLFSAIPLFQHAQQQPKLYKSIFGRHGVELIVHEFKLHLASHIQEQLEARGQDKISAELLSISVAGALLSLLQWWVDHNMPHPPEQMGQLFAKIAVA